MFEQIIIFYRGYCISKQSVKWIAKQAWEELSHLGPSFLYTDVEMSMQTRASGEYLIASTQGRKDSRRLGLVGSSQSYSIIWKRWAPHQLGVCVCVCVCACVCSAANLRLALFNPMDRSLPGSSCPWDFPGGNTGVSCHFLLQGIFPTLGSNLSLLHRQAGSLPPSHLGSPYQLAMVTMTRYGVLTPIGPFMRYETCVSDNFVHCTEHSVPPGFICERICIRQGPN